MYGQNTLGRSLLRWRLCVPTLPAQAAAALEMAAAAAARNSLILEVAAVAGRQSAGQPPLAAASVGSAQADMLSGGVIERELQFEAEARFIDRSLSLSVFQRRECLLPQPTAGSLRSCGAVAAFCVGAPRLTESALLSACAQLRMSAELVTLRAERDSLRFSLRAAEHAFAESQRFASEAHRRLQHALQAQSSRQQQQQGAAALIWWSLFGDAAPGGAGAAGSALAGCGGAGGLSVEEIVQPVQRHLAIVSADRDRLDAELSRRVGGQASAPEPLC